MSQRKDHNPVASTAVEISAKTGVSISTSNGVMRSNGHTATDGVLLEEDQTVETNGSAVDSDMRHQLTGTKKTEEVHGNGVALKDHAKDASIPTDPS